MQTESSPVFIVGYVRIEDTIGSYTLSDAIIETPVEELLILLGLIRIAQQAVGIDHRMAMIVIGTHYLLYRMPHEIYVNGPGHIVSRKVNPVGVLHIDRRLLQLNEFLCESCLLFKIVYGFLARRYLIAVGDKTVQSTQMAQ